MRHSRQRQRRLQRYRRAPRARRSPPGRAPVHRPLGHARGTPPNLRAPGRNSAEVRTVSEPNAKKFRSPVALASQRSRPPAKSSDARDSSHARREVARRCLGEQVMPGCRSPRRKMARRRGESHIGPHRLPKKQHSPSDQPALTNYFTGRSRAVEAVPSCRSAGRRRGECVAIDDIGEAVPVLRTVSILVSQACALW